MVIRPSPNEWVHLMQLLTIRLLYIPLYLHVYPIKSPCSTDHPTFDHGTCHSFIARLLSWRPLKGHAPSDPSVPCGSGVCAPTLSWTQTQREILINHQSLASHMVICSDKPASTLVSLVFILEFWTVWTKYIQKMAMKRLSLSLWYLNQQLSSNASSGILWFERAKPPWPHL